MGEIQIKIVLEETVGKVNSERFWLYAAVDPETNKILHIRLYPSRTIDLTKLFLRELRVKHSVEDSEFFVNGAPWLQPGLFELGMHFQHETFGERYQVAHTFQEIKGRKFYFYNTFSQSNPGTAENWLRALSPWHGISLSERCPPKHS